MILKINFTVSGITGEYLLNWVKEIKKEKVKPKWCYISYSTHEKIYMNRVNKGAFVTDINYSYLFNTDKQPIGSTSNINRIYDFLLKSAKPWLRQIRIDKILD
jgi:hypothetical protein